MVRVESIENALAFYCGALGFVETRRFDSEKGRFTNVFLRAPGDNDAAANNSPLLELTYNWDPEKYTGGRNFGHLAFEVDNIYEKCAELQAKGIVINRPPKEGRMAFINSPEGISIELLQKGEALPIEEPWASMPNIGTWSCLSPSDPTSKLLTHHA